METQTNSEVPVEAPVLEQDEPNVLGAFGLGLLVGTLVGAATATLLAPQPGTRTREVLGDRARQLQERATDLAHEVRGGLEKLSQKMRGTAPDAAAEPQERLPSEGVRIL